MLEEQFVFLESNYDISIELTSLFLQILEKYWLTVKAFLWNICQEQVPIIALIQTIFCFPLPPGFENNGYSFVIIDKQWEIISIWYGKASRKKKK